MAVERKEKIIRVLQLLWDTDENTPINASYIVEQLENEYLIGKTDRRSIYRDVKMLQSCGYPIVQAKNRKLGWYMAEHAFDDWEIKVMMDAIQQAKCVSVEEAGNICEKMLKLASRRSRQRFSHIMKPTSANTKVCMDFGKYIETMLEAMFLHKKIQFQYTEINDCMKRVLRREGKLYTLSLYTIYWSENNYYLIGGHDRYGGLLSYRLDRIENLVMLDETAIPAEEKVGPNPELFIQEYIQKSVDHFSGDPIRIEVEYIPDRTTNAILYDFTGGDLRVQKMENGRCRAIFSKMNSVTLTGWFLQHADMFRVLRPVELREEIVERIARAWEEYEE